MLENFTSQLFETTKKPIIIEVGASIIKHNKRHHTKIRKQGLEAHGSLLRGSKTLLGRNK